MAGCPELWSLYSGLLVVSAPITIHLPSLPHLGRAVEHDRGGADALAPALVEPARIELATSSLRTMRSPS